MPQRPYTALGTLRDQFFEADYLGQDADERLVSVLTQLAFGPPLENGFYYDIDSPTPITEADFPRIEEEMRKIVADAVPEAERKAVARAIAVAGTATSLGAIAQDLDPYDPERVHGYRLEADEAGRILDRLAQMPLEERRQVAGLHPDRAPTIIIARARTIAPRIAASMISRAKPVSRERSV